MNHKDACDLLRLGGSALFRGLPRCETWTMPTRPLYVQMQLGTREPGLSVNVEFQLRELNVKGTQEVADLIESRVLGVVLAAFKGRLEKVGV